MSSIAQASSSLIWIERVCATASTPGLSAAFYYNCLLDTLATKRTMGSVIKKRRKAMNKHKHRKRLKKERWQRRHG